jgi:GNAT superfamily N-acetyltransferase
MRRHVVGEIPPHATNASLSWITHDVAGDDIFLQALDLSYAGSLDCPEVTGLRSTRDVLTGHKAVGAFNPRLWWVVKSGDQPAGVLLLSPLRDAEMLEVVYMGVSQAFRGTGVANALMHRAVKAAGAAGATSLALAVDCRNRPARRLYERWRFRLTGARDAWIAKPDGAGG